MAFLKVLLPLVCLVISVISVQIIQINYNESEKFEHFWKSTGLCPPDPKEDIYKFLLSEEEKINYALIGALPNQGITFIRIHWLFYMIFTNTDGNYNFIYLDELMEYLVRHNLKPTFELMGCPIRQNGSFCGKMDISGDFWQDLVEQIAERYLEKYGFEEISSWKFELWNEPDLKDYNLLNFTLSDYFSYVNGCVEGLKSAFRKHRNVGVLTLGGPAGLFREEKDHPLCWGLLETCNRSGRSLCPIQFISFHRKGDGTAEGVLSETLKLLDLLHNKFSNLTEIPIANDESDIIATWSDSHEWLGDVRYSAMIVKIVADFYKSAKLDRKLKIDVLSNDNAFLNYHPFYFTQRTLFARFQMNHTDPPHNQFIKKPVYSTMALLSYLGNEYLKLDTDNNSNNDPLLTILATRSTNNNNVKQFSSTTTSILLAYGNNSQVNNADSFIKTVQVSLRNLSIGSKFVVYLQDNIISNPYKIWKDIGAPVFPTRNVRNRLRTFEEPFRIYDPTVIEQTKNFNISLNLTIPSVALVHICSKPSHTPGTVTKLSIFNVTGNEVLLTWSDNQIYTKCIRTYQVEFESKCENSLQFRRVNADDTIFLSYHFVTTGDGACETTIGRYRVRAVDYWDQAGTYSEIISYP